MELLFALVNTGFIKSFIGMGFDDYKHLCQKGAQHQGKDVVMICLNAECENKRLCCLCCIDELHRKHELISLYKFQEMLGVLTNKGNQASVQDVLKLIQNFEASLCSEMNQMMYRFQKEIQKNKLKLKSVVGSAKESVNLKFTEEDVEVVYQNLDNAIVNKYLALIKEVEGEALKDVESASKTLENASTFLEKTLQDTEKMYTRGLDDLNSALGKLKKLLGNEGKLSKANLFSKTDKAACINVDADQKSVIRFEGTGSYPIALFEEPLNEFNNSFTVTIKEQPGNKGCWLGVCVKDIVKNLNFGSCYGIGKGTWAIDQVGASHNSAYSWSHHDTAYNSQPKVGFQFMTGDTLTVTLDVGKSLVIFEKGGSKYEMPVQLNLGDVYGFVGCTYSGDKWVIPS